MDQHASVPSALFSIRTTIWTSGTCLPLTSGEGTNSERTILPWMFLFRDAPECAHTACPNLTEGLEGIYGFELPPS